MANVYVRSGAAGAGTGADWTNAYTTLAAAFTAKAAGDSFFVSEDHAETQASAMTLTSKGTDANPCFIYCVNHAGTVPPVSADLRTTATISTTGASSITMSGMAAVCHGIAFSAGSAGNNASINLDSNSVWQYRSCGFVLANTNVASRLNFSSGASSLIEWNSCTVTFGATGQFIQFTNFMTWRNTTSAISGATLPTTLFKIGALGFGANVLLEGVDLSALGSGKTLFDATVAGVGSKVVFKDCKLGASVTVSTTPSGPEFNQVDLFRCDSSGTNYRSERYAYMGTQTVETTIVRTGGASDGTTSISNKIVTTANSKWAVPFQAQPIAIWNDSTSSVTVTVYGIWGGGAVPLNDEIWMDVEYLGASGNPQGSFATTTKADNLATGANTTTDSSTWGGSTTAFKLTATFTPAQKGALYIYIKAAKASSTFYIDPKPVLS